MNYFVQKSNSRENDSYESLDKFSDIGFDIFSCHLS